MTHRTVALDQIDASDRLREIDEDWAQVIAASIEEVGQLEPLVIRPKADGTFKLVAGGHRYRALEIIEAQTAECMLRDFDDAEAELAEIDENLMRRDLNALDRARHLYRRKAIYEELNPETAHGKAPKGGKVANIATLRFTEEVAEKTGLSERTVQDAVALIKNLDPEVVQELQGTPLASNGAQLKALSKLDPNTQKDVAKTIHEGTAGSVKEAVNHLTGSTPVVEPPRDAWMRKQLAHWGEGKKAWKDAFLKEIGVEV